MRRSFRITVLILASLSLTLFSAFQAQQAHAYSPNPNARNVTLYWHYETTSVSVGGIQSNYVLNSSARFDFSTQQLAKQNSFYKPSGLPSTSLDFYTYPNLAGPVIVNGTWQVFLWANSSANTPATFNIQFREYALGSGTPTYDSGLISPIVTSPIGKYLDVPVYSYNLTTPTVLAHTFAAGSTIDVSVSVNPGAASDARIWYDSPSYQSKVILPVVNPEQPAKIWTADSSGTIKSVFPLLSQTVLIATNVTDPFGGYDVNATVVATKNAPVTLTVTAPGGSALLSNQRMIQLSGGASQLNNIFRFNATIPATAGNYTATVSSTDNSGNTEQLSYSFTLATTAPPQPPSLTIGSLLIPLAIIAAVIAVIAALLFLRRGRKNRLASNQTLKSQ
jgi:hypothetical protein